MVLWVDAGSDSEDMGRYQGATTEMLADITEIIGLLQFAGAVPWEGRIPLGLRIRKTNHRLHRSQVKQSYPAS